MGLFVARRLAFICRIRKRSGTWRCDVVSELSFYLCTSVYEIAFELMLRNIYIFELPLVDDRNKIWFTWLFLRYVLKPSLLFLTHLHHWENRNIKILSVIEDFPGFLGIKAAFIKDFSYPRSVFFY